MSTGSPVVLTIHGEPASLKNSRQLVMIRGKPAFIKSAKARRYAEDFYKQCPRLTPLLEGDLSIEITIYYASRRPDLDPSGILDCLQGRVIENDRQIKEMHLYHGLDKADPSAEIQVQKKAPSSEGATRNKTHHQAEISLMRDSLSKPKREGNGNS